MARSVFFSERAMGKVALAPWEMDAIPVLNRSFRVHCVLASASAR